MFLITGAAIFVQAQNLCEDVLNREEKEQKIVKLFTPGSKTFTFAEKFASEVKTKSIAEQNEWVSALGATYRKVPKKNPSPTASFAIGGRRLIDRALSLIERYNDKMKFHSAQDISGNEIYRLFLERQKEIFNIQYTDKELTVVISYLKGELNQLKKVTPYSKSEILLAGSFVNGKASLQTSDLDMTISDPKWIREIPRWQSHIQNIFSVLDLKTKLTLEAHGEPAAFYGKTNPMVIRIQPEHVDLMVFPPAYSSQTPDGLTSREPDIYPMNF